MLKKSMKGSYVMKRVLSVLLVFAMMISVAPSVVGGTEYGSEAGTVSVVGGSCGENVNWSFDESSGTLTISGEGEMNDYAYDGMQEYYDVLHNANRVVIEEGITSIGEGAFQYCPMTEISFPSTLKAIGGFAFAKADQLQKIEYNGCSIESIGERAFYGCWRLENFYIFNPECIIGEGVFNEAYSGKISGYSESTAQIYANTYGIEFNDIAGSCGENLKWELNSNMELVISPVDNTLPNKMTEWGGDVWMPWDYFADDIKSATICDGVEDITRYTFTCYPNLETITIPDSVTMIENISIHDCRGLKNISVSSNNPTYKSENGILFTKNMDTIIQYPSGKEEMFYAIPDSVATVAEGAFAYNSNLMTIQLPASVSFVTEGAFGIANSLQNITVVDENEYYISSDGVLYTEDMKGLIAYPTAKQYEDFMVPDHVEWIAADAFNSVELHSVSFCEGLESIGSYAFANCRNLTEIELPSSLRYIENSAFAYCENLFRVTIANGVSHISKRAFQECPNMNEIIVPTSVTEIGDGAFDCGSESLVIRGHRGTIAEEYALNNNISFAELHEGEDPGIVVSGMCGDSVTWMFDELTGTLTIGGEGAMYDFDEDTNPPEFAPLRDRINRVVIEDGVSTIGDCAFQYCDAMTEIMLPASLSYVGCLAFAKSGLSHIEYNNCMIDVIGDDAFYGCWNLTDFFVYNPDCRLGSTAFSESGITGLVGYAGSTADEYARNHGLNFTALDGGDVGPDPGQFMFPIELRFHEDTYFNGSVQANVLLIDLTNTANTVTQTVYFNGKETQYLMMTPQYHTDASRYFVRVIYRGTLDTNIDSNVQYLYAENGGLTTEMTERAILDKPEQPIVIYAPQKNTINGKIHLPEDYWCEDEDANLTNLWVEIYDGADHYIGFAEAEVDENLNYSFVLPAHVLGNYTFKVKPIFTKGAEEEIVNPRTNLVLKYYELYHSDGYKQYYGAGTDGTPVYGAHFTLESGPVVSGTLCIPAEASMDNAQLSISVSGFKPENYNEENCEGDYYFEIEYEEGRSEYDWYFAVERDTEIIVGYNLFIQNQEETNTNLLGGTFFSRDLEQMTDRFDDASRYWSGGDTGIRMELRLNDGPHDEITDSVINDFVNEVYRHAKDYNYDELFNIFNDNKEILEHMGVDYIRWADSSENVRCGAVEVLITKINWLAIDFTPEMFVDFFKESLEISRVSRADSWEKMRESLYELGRFVDDINRIESLRNPQEAYRRALEYMRNAGINSMDAIQSMLIKAYEEIKKNEEVAPSPGGGSGGGGGVSLTINAIDSNTLEVIEGVQIFVTNEDESIRESGVSDDEGKVYLPVGSGVYSVQAIADGYQMRNFVVEKTDENYEFTVYMSQNDILQVETNVKEMTYDEIIDAGIDVDAIENKQVYNCTAVLTFSPSSSSGSTGGGTLPENITFDYICTDTEVFNAEPIRFGNTSVCPVAKDVYLIIYSSTTWLKEMFEIQLLVTNTSAIETIRDGIAKINLPEGLSLAVMNEELGQQSEEVSIGMIDPQGNADIRWYLCGDAEGEYTIGGTVWGVREGGGISEDISVRFTSKEKISVFGGNALKLTIRAEKAATVGEPYRVEYVLQNVSPKDLYNVEINILGGKFLTEFSVENLIPPYGWEGSLANGFIYRDAILESGETLSGVFEVIFAEGIDTDYAEYVLSNMFVVAGNGSTVNVPTDIDLVDEIVTHHWDHGTVTKEATCDEEGEMAYQCTDARCDDVKITKIPAKGHAWDEGVITREPTETAEGEKTYTCSRCGETKTEPVKRIEKQDISFLVDEINYTYGDRSAIYHYAYNDSEGGGQLTYVSSNEDVATVDHRGKVTIHNAGEAIITAIAAAVPGRYLETATSYKLIINKAELHIRANDHVIYYGDAPKNSGYSVDGFVNGETASILSGKAIYSYDYEKYGEPGDYNITVSGFSARNYDIWYEEGILCVERAVNYEINIGNLTQRKGSVEPVTVSTTPLDDSAKFTVEYQNAEGEWQDDVPTEIGEYKVRAYLVDSRNLNFGLDSWTEAVLTIKAGAMIDVGGETGGVDVGINTSDEIVEIIVDEKALEEVINNIPSTGEVVIDVKGNGEKKELVLPSNLVDALHESEQAKEVTVIADDAEICVSPDALKKVAETMEANDKVGISIGAVEKDKLNKEQQQALDAISKDAVVLSLNMVVSKYDNDGNKVAEEKIHEFDGKVNVRAAYEMPAEDNGKRVIVCYVSDDASVTYIRAEYTDGYVEFETDHFSHFAVMTIGGEPGINVSLRTTEAYWNFDHITVGDDVNLDNAIAYIGIYNEQGVLIGAETKEFETSKIDSIPMSKIAEAKYAVVYVWEKDTMKPLTDNPKSFDL